MKNGGQSFVVVVTFCVFYRLIIEEVDSDGDGVSDYLEFLIGSNAFAVDTDGDGTDDETEITYGSNPWNAASTPANVIPPPVLPGYDTDRDGLDDTIDFDPLDPNINWRATPIASYVPFVYTGSTNLRPIAVNNRGEALLDFSISFGPFGTMPLTSELWHPIHGSTYISPGSVNFTYNVIDEEEEPVAVSLSPTAAIVHDINDYGEIVGAVIFTGTQIISTGGTPGISSITHSVAARWDTASSAPVLIHTGKEEDAAPDGSDILLPSEATKINNTGEIIGLAAVVDDQEVTEMYTTRWGLASISSPGTPQFSTESPPDLTTLSLLTNLSESNDPSQQYFGSSVSGGAGVWDTWGEHPQSVIQEIGDRAIESALMPNNTRAILGTERLLLNTLLWQQVPAVRRIPGALHITDRGTIFRSNDSGAIEFWHAARMRPFKVKVSGIEEDVTAIGDVSSKGIVLGQIDGGDYAVLLPATIDVVHIEKQRDQDGNETEKIVEPGAGKLLRDEIAELHIRIPPLAAANGQLSDWELKIDVDTTAMQTQTLDSRGPVQMYDFGTVDEQTGIVTPLSIIPATNEDPASTKEGPYDILLPASGDGLTVLRVVVNKEGVFKISLNDTVGTIDVESDEIVTVNRIRKYGVPYPGFSNHDPNRYDEQFQDAVDFWGAHYQHEIDTVDRIKAMSVAESNVGALPDRANDILSIGNLEDEMLATMKGDPEQWDLDLVHLKKPAADARYRKLNYPNANYGTTREAIKWGVLWLYAKAYGQSPPFNSGIPSTIKANPAHNWDTRNKTPYSVIDGIEEPEYQFVDWHAWVDATPLYNGGGDPDNPTKVDHALYKGLHIYNTITKPIWPRVTDKSARP